MKLFKRFIDRIFLPAFTGVLIAAISFLFSIMAYGIMDGFFYNEHVSAISFSLVLAISYFKILDCLL